MSKKVKKSNQSFKWLKKHKISFILECACVSLIVILFFIRKNCFEKSQNLNKTFLWIFIGLFIIAYLILIHWQSFNSYLNEDIDLKNVNIIIVCFDLLLTMICSFICYAFYLAAENIDNDLIIIKVIDITVKKNSFIMFSMIFFFLFIITFYYLFGNFLCQVILMIVYYIHCFIHWIINKISKKYKCLYKYTFFKNLFKKGKNSYFNELTLTFMFIWIIFLILVGFNNLFFVSLSLLFILGLGLWKNYFLICKTILLKILNYQNVSLFKEKSLRSVIVTSVALLAIIQNNSSSKLIINDGKNFFQFLFSNKISTGDKVGIIMLFITYFLTFLYPIFDMYEFVMKVIDGEDKNTERSCYCDRF